MKRNFISTSTSLECHSERPSTTLRTALSERSESNGRSRTIRLTVCISLLCFSLFLPALSADSNMLLYEDNPKASPEISMDFQDANLKDVLKVFSIQSGLNFIASEAVQDRKITLYLDRVPLKKAMEKLFKANNLSYELDKDANIFIVKDWGKLQTETETRVFYLKYATVSSSSLEKEKGSCTTSGTGTSSTTGKTTSTTTTGGTSAETGITSAVKKLLSQDGSVIEDARTNSLIVTDTPNRMQVIAQVIASLDVSVPQVMLEVEMLDVSKNTVDKLGVKWATPLASLTVSGTKETSFPFGDKGTSGFGRTIDPVEGVFDTQISNANWDFGAWNATHFGPSILTVIGATLTLDFLRTQADTKVLARPRILTLNNQPAEIKITTQEAVGSITTTQGQGTASVTTTSAERIETGVSLRVTPQINFETGDITMFINPTVKDATTSTFNTSYKDPEERSTKSVVRIKDGETVIVGGLIRNDRSETITKLPFFGDIPLIGGLFRHKYKDKDKERELLVFITPHIIRDTGIRLARTKKAVFAEREQNEAWAVNRESSIKNSLNSFQEKR